MTKLVFLYPAREMKFSSRAVQSQLCRDEPVYRTALEKCDEVVQRELGWSVRKNFLSDIKHSLLREEHVSATVTATQIALTELLRSWGITPDAAAGICAGERGAFYAAGLMSLEYAMFLACKVSRLIRRAPPLGVGIYVEVQRKELEELRLLAPRPFVFGAELGLNRSYAVCAMESADALLTFFRDRKINCSLAPSQLGYHGPAMQSWEEELMKIPHIDLSKNRLPVYSCVVGGRLHFGNFEPAHWYHLGSQPVLLMSMLKETMEDDCQTFLFIGYHPEVLKCIDEMALHLRKPVAVLSMKRLDQTRKALKDLGIAVTPKRLSIKEMLLRPLGLGGTPY